MDGQLPKGRTSTLIAQTQSTLSTASYAAEFNALMTDGLRQRANGCERRQPHC